jgi:hypothetical protein
MALRSEALEEEATETTAFLPIFVASFIDERSRELRQGFVPSSRARSRLPQLALRRKEKKSEGMERKAVSSFQAFVP